jgi:hypothetical protein
MPPTAAATLWFCFVILPTFIVHTIFAFAVDRDARRLTRGGGNLVFTGAFVWAGATLLGGPLVALAYWIIHRSALALSVSPDET